MTFIKLLLGVALILILLMLVLPFFNQQKSIAYGVTFVPKYAQYLGLDWKKTYLQILDELKVKHLRLPSDWDRLEKTNGHFDFSETDFLLTEAVKRQAQVILVVGDKQPRWPECQIPSWAKSLPVTKRQQLVLQLIEKVVERYKDNSAITAWQVENEPLIGWFGENCDPPDKTFLQQEVNLVKKLDHRPIIITDSGEWGDWLQATSLGDSLGISIYRKSYNSSLHAYTPYFFPAGFYQIKAWLIQKLQNKPIIVTELQTEPWLSMTDPTEIYPVTQSKRFSLADFKANIEYTKRLPFAENYLWGVEWWYWMKQQGYPEYLNYAKSLFK